MQKNDWLKGYADGAFVIKGYIKTFGWARAKGIVKDIIRYKMHHPASWVSHPISRDWNAGYIDAILDSVN